MNSQFRPGSVTFIGGGNMARSLISGLLTSGTPSDLIEVIEPVENVRHALKDTLGVRVAADITQAKLDGETCVLAVKPQVLRSVCEAVAGRLQPGQSVVSIAAGITTTLLSQWLGKEATVIRAMPNTPALLGAGMTGLYAAPSVAQSARDAAGQVLLAAGHVRWLDDESLMDAVTAVSGSGPAYVFALAEAMEAAGRQQGLDQEAARLLVLQTILGAARMLTESGQSPTALRQAVTSPNGTTQAALETLQEGGFTALVGQAIDAATQRGRALSAGQ